MEKLDSNTLYRELRNNIYSLEREVRYVSGVDRVDVRNYDVSSVGFSFRLQVRLNDGASRRWAESDIKNKIESFVNNMIYGLSRNYDVSDWRYPRFWIDIDFEGGQ